MGQHVQKIFYMYATIDHRDHILGLLFIQERKDLGNCMLIIHQEFSFPGRH